jgi:glucose-1-phosphate adenylyltransferase
VVILSGDQLYRINLNDFLKYHKGKNADITIATKQIPREMTREFGLLKLGVNQQIVDFVEKPKNSGVLKQFVLPVDIKKAKNGSNFLASMGIYIFKKEVLVKLLEKDVKEDFGREVIPDAIKIQKVFSYWFDGYWEDIGTVKSFFLANLDFANPVPKFNFYDEKNPIYTRARFLPGSKVKNCEMNNTLVCDGSILEGSKISQSIIGIRSVINEGSELNRVVMMGADFYEMEESTKKVRVGIGKNCFIKNAILDKNVRIGDNVIIDCKGGTDQISNGNLQIVDGIVVVQKNQTIPDNTRIE